MNKNNTPWVVAASFLTLLLMSSIFNFKLANLVSEQRLTINHLSHKVDEQQKALDMSDGIMDNNDIWDCDGSDLMVDYLNLRSKIDKDFMSGFHENALLDSLSYTYNE